MGPVGLSRVVYDDDEQEDGRRDGGIFVFGIICSGRRSGPDWRGRCKALILSIELFSPGSWPPGVVRSFFHWGFGRIGCIFLVSAFVALFPMYSPWSGMAWHGMDGKGAYR